MLIKICGITNQEDAQAAAAAGATAIGFNFYRDSPRYVSPTGAALIAATLPATVLKVGVFVDDSPQVIARISLQVGLDVAQLHGLAQCDSLPTWRAVPIQNALDVASFIDQRSEVWLLDTASPLLPGGTGKTFRWDLAREAKNLTAKPIVIAGGLDETNVQQAIAEAQPWGVDACSRLESSPGRKDHARMKNFIAAALKTT